MNMSAKPKQGETSGFFVEWQLTGLGGLSDRRPKVLVVAADPDVRDRLGRWLASEGHEVIECPGPGEPDYVCVGGRRGDCPLAKIADVVVLDLHLKSDAVMTGTRGWQLLEYYVSRGHSVVAISGREQMGRYFLDARVITLDRPVDRSDILAAVASLSQKRSTVAEIGSFRLTPRNRVHRPYGTSEFQTMLHTNK